MAAEEDFRYEASQAAEIARLLTTQDHTSKDRPLQKEGTLDN